MEIVHEKREKFLYERQKACSMLFTQMYLIPNDKNILNMNRWGKYTKAKSTKRNTGDIQIEVIIL